MVAGRLTCVAVVLASAVAIGACGDEYVQGAGVYSVTATGPAAQVPSTMALTPAQSTDGGGIEGSEADRLTSVQRRVVRAASRAARRFLSGYLPYSYGRRDARRIRSVSPGLRRALARQTPRVPAALAKKARPRLQRLQLSGIAAARRVILLAHIDDGQSRYVALLTVQRRGDRWAVGEVR